jgi:ribose/xylose/arabinose/galactoside ABC-type transport system permease subunit
MSVTDQGTRRDETVETPGRNGASWRSPSRIVDRVLRFGLLPVMLAASVLIFYSMEPRFVSVANATNISRQLAFLIIISIAQMLVLLTAELDMSVGSNIALTSVVSAQVMNASGVEGGTVIVVGLMSGLAVGLVIGLVNGLLVSLLRLPSFIVTISTASAAAGIALVLSDATPITNLPVTFVTELSRNLGPVPIVFVLSVALALAMHLVLTWTALGTYLYAVGGGAQAARLVGVSIVRTKVFAFVACGMLTSLAGVLLTARVSSGQPTLGTEYVILAIAAAVLGGTSLFGGEGRVGLVVLGALFLIVLSNGMNVTRVSSYSQQVVLGVMLVLAIVVDRIRIGARA